MIAIAAGGFVVLAAIGAWLRAELSRLDARPLPVGTIAANTIASFVAGLVTGSTDTTVALVGVALCGSLSTFSTLVRHLHDQAEGERSMALIATLGLSIGLGLAAAVAGIEIGSS